MNAIISALVGSGVTGLIGWVTMRVRSRRREKGDRIGDLRLDVNQRFDEHRERLARIEQKLDIDPPPRPPSSSGLVGRGGPPGAPV